MTGNRPDVAALASRAAGEDDEDPYDDVDVSELPDWWRRAVAEFERHGLRPYRPPRFADGTLKYEVVERLEADLDASIRFVCPEPGATDSWTVEVDGESIGSIDRERVAAGYSTFRMDAAAFEEWVRREVDASDA